MKKYEQPQFTITKFEIEDIITISSADINGGDTSFPGSWVNTDIDGESTNFIDTWQR